MNQRVTIRPRGPFTLRKGGGPLFHLSSPIDRVYEGEFDIEIEDINAYVQVAYLGTDGMPRGMKLYTYFDPSSSLKVGDIVEAPTSHGLPLAEVVKLGRGDYQGDPRSVSARFLRLEL